LQIAACLRALVSASSKVRVLLNAKAGGGHAPEELSRALREAGMEAELSAARPGEDVRELAQRALKERPNILVAAGGDGTVSAIASVVRGTDTALGVLPLGTLNHFARDLRIPLELDKAVRTIAAGRRVAVDTGDVNGLCFLNNASLGLYPNIVRERKHQQRRFGRSKRSAMLWATLAVLNRPPLLEVDLELHERRQVCSAPFIFIGNNGYVMEGFNIGTRERLDAGRLSVYTTQRPGRASLIMLALRALFARLRQAEDFVAFSVRSLRVASWRSDLLVAHDGEVSKMRTPLEFRIRPRSLHVIVP
jgi:diacylglycerol kinase family enzyme